MALAGHREIYTANLYGGPELRSESLIFPANDRADAVRIANDWATAEGRARHFAELDLYLADALIYRRSLARDRTST